MYLVPAKNIRRPRKNISLLYPPTHTVSISSTSAKEEEEDEEKENEKEEDKKNRNVSPTKNGLNIVRR